MNGVKKICRQLLIHNWQ